MADPITVIVEDPDDSVRTDPATGTIETDLPDGRVVVQLDARRASGEAGEDDFYRNLADEVGDTGAIANQLIESIEADDRSRQKYLDIRRRGLVLLGIELKEPKQAVESGEAATTQSVVTHPLLLEAVLKGWANARGELLPAEGPVKIAINAAEGQVLDDLAEQLERDMNHYLTVTATEYYPDTSHMLLWGTYFGGSGFKKVYRCPMRRRPVSESVEPDDLIVSDAVKDFRSCARITHQITMRPSVMKRMMLLGAYRDVALTQPRPEPNAVDREIGQIQGITVDKQRPEDQPHTVWETQCELDLPEFAPTQFKNEGIPLPYRVTIEKDSRAILAVRRDWREDDEDCQRIRLYIKYPYVPGPGFYGTGLLNILGNSSAAMTAAWREALDAGMFASFPGGFVSKIATRQATSNFRAGPAEFLGIETGNMRIGDVVMPYPYRDVTPGLMNLMDKIEMTSTRLGGAAEVVTQEGLANVPVGTMLAQIEQATKVMSAAHKDMHQAQSEEIQLLLDLFRDHPEDFWRGNRHGSYWNQQKFLEAVNTYELTPRSDPNTPSHIHRVMKAVAYVQLLGMPQTAPYLDPKAVVMRVVRALRDDPAGVVIDPPPPQPGGDPAAMMTAQARMQEAQAKIQNVAVQGAKVQADAASKGDEAKVRMAELQAQQQIENTRLEREWVIHQRDNLTSGHDMALNARRQALEERKHQLDQAIAAHEAMMKERQLSIDAYSAMNPPKPAAPKKG